ncbi:MAG: aspartyl/asparaginyl beta-hydroxylase domain-containing protein [Pseudomonadales bacterium]|nr:aspartyl/asparaginyl beta-hydroxylase domain-containing protein [Pseudomonadales bacterium]
MTATSNIDTRLQVPIAARLNQSFDVPRLVKDLEVAKAKYTPAAQSGPYHDGNWKGIFLRNADGDYSKSVPVMQGVGKDTEVLKDCPYFKEILDSLGTPIHTARLLFLPPDKKIGRHSDSFTWEAGIVRLHIPIVTHEKVKFMLGEKFWQWKPGEFWFGDFSQVHSIHNQSDVLRVHLVIDCSVTENLLSYFDSNDGNAIRKECNLTIHKDEIELPTTVLDDLCGFFSIPKEIAPLPFIGKVVRDGNHLEIKFSGAPFIYRFVPITENKLSCMDMDISTVDTSNGRAFRIKSASQNIDTVIYLSDTISVGQRLISVLQFFLGKSVYALFKFGFWGGQLRRRITGTGT